MFTKSESLSAYFGVDPREQNACGEDAEQRAAELAEDRQRQLQHEAARGVHEEREPDGRTAEQHGDPLEGLRERRVARPPTRRQQREQRPRHVHHEHCGH